MADENNETATAVDVDVADNNEAGAGDAGSTEDATVAQDGTKQWLSPTDTFKASMKLWFDFKAPFAFRSRFQVHATRAIPVVTTILLIATADDWGKVVDLPIWYRVTLFVHAFYFFSACDSYEIFGDAFGILISRDPDYRMPRDNVTWFDKFVLGDLMFSLAAYYLILGLQQTAPAFSLYLPIIQCVYNFRNDVCWMVGSMSPETPKRPIIPFAFSDAAFIWTFGIIYIIHFILEAA